MIYTKTLSSGTIVYIRDDDLLLFLMDTSHYYIARYQIENYSGWGQCDDPEIADVFERIDMIIAL